jgi:Rps23 Pro-64 3,4-dihydroxylase Tpa1-like proline 4-hydroxylase
MTGEPQGPAAVLDWARLDGMADALRADYQGSEAPHAVIDGLLDAAAVDGLGLDDDLRAVLRSDALGRYEYVNQSTESTVGPGALPPAVRAIVDALHGPRFVAWLSALTGIPGLLPDPDLGNGGVFLLRPGGFMNLHHDDTIHPFRRTWLRRVNLVLYLNKGWREEYQGHLELWSRDGERLLRRVSPVFNRCFLSAVERNTHGMPDAVRCPAGDARKSLSLWYYTDEGRPVRFEPVAWKPRPADGAARRAAIFVEDKAYWLYHAVKWRLGVEAAEGEASRGALALMRRVGYTRLAAWVRARTG